MRYERARLRKALSEPDRLTAVERAARQARARQAQALAAAEIIDAHVSRAAPGLFRIGADFAKARPEAALYALRILLALAGGRSQLVEAGRAVDLISRLDRGERLRATLSRCVIEGRGKLIFLHREARGLPEIVLGEEPVEWDGRYRIARNGPGGGGGLVIGPAGDYVEVPDSSAPAALVRAAARAEPCVRSLSAAAEEGPPDLSCVPLIGPWSRHLPSFDLAAARAVSRLVGGPEIGPAPLARHNRVT
jgi:tRNA(Ile)-lysidine synthase